MGTTFHKKVSYNLISQLIGKGVSVMVAFMTLSYMAQYLGEAGIGQYATIIKFVGIFGIMADFGMNVITTRELSKPGANEEKILGNAFSLRFVLSIIILLLAPLIALFFPYTAAVKWGMLIGVLAFLFVLWTGIFNSVLQKNMRTDKIALADIIIKCGMFLGVMYAIQNNYGLYAFVYALILGNAAGFFLSWYLASKYVKLTFQIDWELWKNLINYAYPIALTNFFILIYFNIDTIFLSVMKGAHDTGVYHLAYRVLETIMNFSYSFSMLFIPIFTEHVSMNNTKKFLHYFYQSIKYIIGLALPISIAGIILAPWIIQMLAGGKFTESVLVLQILFGAVFFVFLNSLITNTLSVLELQKKAVKIYAFGAVFNIVTNAIFIPMYSYHAAAITTIISEALIFIGTSYLLMKWVRSKKSSHVI